MFTRLEIEEHIRQSFNRKYSTSASKITLRVGCDGAEHEYDLFESGTIIGGITTSPWKNRTGTINTGGQDRAAAESLWLTLWEGEERRVMIFSDKEMSVRLLRRWKGCNFPYVIELFHWDQSLDVLDSIGFLP